MTRFERKIVLILVGAGLVPLVATVWLADQLVRESVAIGFRRPVVDRLERSLELHHQLLESWRARMTLETEAFAGSVALSSALAGGEETAARLLDGRLRELGRGDDAHPTLIRLEIRGPRPVRRSGPPPHGARRTDEIRRPIPGGGELVAVYTTPESAIREYESAAAQVRTIRDLRAYVKDLRRKYVLVFLAMLFSVLLLSSAVGLTFSRRVTRRIAVLHEATEAVGAGDLSVRVPVGPDDEIGELTGAFNRMVEEVSDSRAKIAYLSKISVWQDVARRLAHEIKNPLQPIQLAMQELHRRHGAQGGSADYQKLLDSTLEIVEEELGTLRRLTTEFSTFARLPEVRLVPDDLHELLRDCAAAPALPEAAGVSVEWRVPLEPCIVPMDRMLLRRVIDNLVRNAVEAVRAARVEGTGRVVVSAESDPGRRRARIRVADDGPGVPEDARERLFDPYFTTKADGTGLGLAIVKKVVLDHGGTIDVGASTFGGAEFLVTLPLRSASMAGSLRPT
jgi:nitrogen fixation/metabolism regulation signal transduction histidine kinase